MVFLKGGLLDENFVHSCSYLILGLGMGVFTFSFTFSSQIKKKTTRVIEIGSPTSNPNTWSLVAKAAKDVK